VVTVLKDAKVREVVLTMTSVEGIQLSPFAKRTYTKGGRSHMTTAIIKQVIGVTEIMTEGGETIVKILLGSKGMRALGVCADIILLSTLSTRMISVNATGLISISDTGVEIGITSMNGKTVLSMLIGLEKEIALRDIVKEGQTTGKNNTQDLLALIHIKSEE
jgi:hypothetical protein